MNEFFKTHADLIISALTGIILLNIFFPTDGIFLFNLRNFVIESIKSIVTII